MFDDRKFVVIFSDDVNKIDFSQILEDSPNTMRKSLDGKLTFIKYDGQMPPTITALVNKSQEFTHEQFMLILSGPDWTEQ